MPLGGGVGACRSPYSASCTDFQLLSEDALLNWSHTISTVKRTTLPLAILLLVLIVPAAVVHRLTVSSASGIWAVADDEISYRRHGLWGG